MTSLSFDFRPSTSPALTRTLIPFRPWNGTRALRVDCYTRRMVFAFEPRQITVSGLAQRICHANSIRLSDIFRAVSDIDFAQPQAS